MTKRFLSLLPLVLLAACARSEPEDAPDADAPVERPAAPEPAAVPSPSAAPTAPYIVDLNANDVAELPPGEPIAPDEQMLDDASATGMTARAEREKEEATDPLPANAEEL